MMQDMESKAGYQDPPWEEIIDGQTVVMYPRPGINHSFVAGNIYCVFANFLRGTSCEAFLGEFYLCLSERDNFIPDVAVICDRSILKEDGIYGAPSLVVEILSPLTAKWDRGYKKDTYEAAGVKEYWLVNIDSKSIEVYLLKDGRYTLDEVYSIYPDYLLERMTEEARAAIPTEFRCSLFDDLTIRLEDVFERVM